MNKLSSGDNWAGYRCGSSDVNLPLTNFCGKKSGKNPVENPVQNSVKKGTKNPVQNLAKVRWKVWVHDYK